MTNTGNVSLANVVITDNLAAPAAPALTVTCPAGPLAPGATITCTAAYVTTQADVDNGSVNNQATATATAPDNSTLTSDPSTASVPITQAPALTLVKSVTPTTAHAAGDRVAYTFAVSNSGDTTITGLAIDDTFTAPAGPLPAISCPVTTPGSGSGHQLLRELRADPGRRRPRQRRQLGHGHRHRARAACP